MTNWEFNLGLFVLGFVVCYASAGTCYAAAWRVVARGVTPWMLDLTDGTTVQDKEAELKYRKNEVVITRRLVLVMVSNIVVWIVLITLTCLSFSGVQIDRTLSSWTALFLVPVNAALDP